MLEIRIDVRTDGLNEAIKELAKALGQCRDSERSTALNTVPQDAPVDSHIEVTTEGTKVSLGKAPEAEQPKAEPAAVADPVKPEAPKTSKAKPAAKKEELAPAPAQAPAPAPAPAPEKKTYTFKQISEAGAALCTDPAKIDALIALLRDKYHINAITSLKEEQYSDLAEDLIGLGATIKEG